MDGSNEDTEACTSHSEKNGKSNEEVAENNKGPTEEHLKVLTTKFGLTEFHPLQWDILTVLMEEKRDVIAVMGTGYGNKSLCYQFPSVYSGRFTIVISPLISLMQDQVAKLQLSNIAACSVGTVQQERKKVAKDVLRNKYRITYLTPEFCDSDFGVQFLIRIRERLSVDLIAIEEAHCISRWGHDFCPQFRKLDVLRLCFPKVPILALTATATPEIVAEITKYLKLRNPFTLYTDDNFDRPNLFLGVQRKTDEIMKDLHKVMIMKNGKLQFSGPTIIYCITNQQIKDVNATLSRNGYSSVSYHSGLKMERRKVNYEKFLNNKVDILVATIAFDMGVNKPDVRNVVHYGCSASLEEYYREIGRAGRDGLPARCTTFFNDFDFVTHSLSWGNDVEEKQEKLDLLCYFLEMDSCRREHILEYFKDTKGTQVSNTINCCDNCVKRLSSNVSDNEAVQYDGLYDFIEDAKIILNSIEQIGPYNSMTIVLDFLTGTINIKTGRHKNKSYFGAGKRQTKTWWKAVINLLIQNGFLSEHDQKIARNFTFKSLRISDNGRNVLNTPRVLYLRPSNEFLDLLKDKPVRPGWIVEEDEQAGAMDTEPSPSSDFDEKVLQLNKILLKTRENVAKTLECRSYLIASNTAIMDLAKKMPMSIKEFEDADIAGINKVKFSKFAYYFVKAIRQFCSNRKPSLRDVLLREPRVIQNGKLGVSAEATYNLYKKEYSVRDIASRRNLTVATVKTHLITCLKLGLDVRLSVFDINKEMFHEIMEVFDTNGGYHRNEVSTIVANLMPGFTYIQKKAVFWYIKIRKHLEDLSIEYEEFDEFNCTEDDKLEMVEQNFENEPSDSHNDDKENHKESTMEHSSAEGDDDDGPSRKIQKVDYLQEQNPLELLLAAAEHLEKREGKVRPLTSSSNHLSG